jgi:hypothetical protein
MFIAARETRPARRPSVHGGAARRVLLSVFALLPVFAFGVPAEGAWTSDLAARSTAPPVAAIARSSASSPLSGHYPIAFLLCNFKNWRYKPNSLSYYRKLWTRQNSTGTFSSLADYFHDVSYGKMDLKGSKVLGWYRIPIGEKAWYSGGNGNRLPVRWLSCVNAALAQGGLSIKTYHAVVAVTPYVQGVITGAGLAAEPALKPGQKRPATQQMTVDSTKNWPPAPFLMSLPPDSLSQYGENVLVSKMSGKTITLTRGYNEGQTQLGGPFPAIGPGGTVIPDTDDDFGYVGQLKLYLQSGGQHCTRGKKLCPSISTSPRPLNPHFAITNAPISLGVANVFAGDNKHDGNITAGVGDAAHEVGHATGYNHSRVLTSSTTDYNDCYDEMSFNACGLPGFKGLFGPPGGVIGYDAIDLEYHGWLPTRFQYNAANHAVKQVTIKLHALSDPRALRRSKGEHLDAHIPASIRIEDVSPNVKKTGVPVSPTIPPTCSGNGYHCTTSKYYTVEYRQLYGFDASLREAAFGAGFGGAPPVGAVVLHLYAPDNGIISYLVDSYPGKAQGRGLPVYLPHDAALQPGDDYADPAGNTYVGVNAFRKKAFTATVTLSSSPIIAKLNFPGRRSAKEGTTAKLEAKLIVGGAPVPQQLVSLSLGPSQGCGPVLTNSAGLASCDVKLTNVVGTRPFQAYFAGDPVYRPIVVYSTFSVTS